ncbi:MAG TPA: PDZ domain-containing protein, partial [Candidatus Handelsmanbacteria bacterium]|nr:PDZ domain-containing protein [Candidatus Handelsmanbacteria bacterium]
QHFGLDVEAGVLVAEVHRGSVAARAGVRPRDLIVEINRQAVHSVNEYEEALEAAQGTALLMIRRVRREGIRTDIVVLRLPD